MIAKLTSKNQLTLPKAAIDTVGASEYFSVETRAGQIVLTPVRIQRADAVRAKLAALALTPADVDDAVTWARSKPKSASLASRVAEPSTPYIASKPAKRKAKKTALGKSQR